jgi:uncharacterized protein YfaA (DUF2138 family)
LAGDKLGLSRPDALLETRSLSQLPKDLLTVPFLKATLTEDFVFYYETHADRLGLIGSLRRIIYEHDLKLQDSLIEAAFRSTGRCRPVARGGWSLEGFPAGDGSRWTGQAAGAAGESRAG